MNSRILAIGSLLFVSALACCGGDDTSDSDMDAGMDGGAGSGGAGGKGTAGAGGKSSGGSGGAEAGAGGKGGTGGTGGQGGSGGTGGSGNEPMYSVGGKVEGLNGKGLVIKLNDGEDKDIAKSGDFEFSTLLAEGDDYSVMVKTQPTEPTQACAVANATGKVGSADITNVAITCSDVVKSVGGSVSGLGGGQVVLKNNGGDDLTVSADGTFSFATPLKVGASYAVTVATPPSGRSCNVAKGTGSIGANNVTDVAVDCYANVTLAIHPRVASAELSWNDNGAQSYTAYLSTDPMCTFDTPDTCAGAAKKENIQSPYVWMGLTNGTTYYFQVRGSHPNNFQTRSAARGARPNEAEFDKAVNAVTLGGDGTIYVGGRFESIGVLTGPLVPLDKQTASATRMPSFPIFDGGISAILADGSGGYFVGGAFTYAGSGSTRYLVHVLPDGSIDPTWDPAPNNTVSTMARVGSTLYIGGTFTMVGGAARTLLAAVSTTGTGAVADWDPGQGWTTTSGQGVGVIVANATTVYVGGTFTQVGATARDNLAAIDASGTGTLVATFTPNPNTTVTALELSADSLYVAGWFDTIGGEAREHLASLDLVSGAPKAGFNPGPDRAPETLSLADGVLYLGGDFAAVGSDARAGLAAVNASSGAVAAWAPAADGLVHELIASGANVYVAGAFEKISDTTRKYLAAIDTQGMLTSWDPRPGDTVETLAVDADTVYASGPLVRTYGAEPHARLASFTSESLNVWAPEVGDGEVLALETSGTDVYLGGTFTSVGGSARLGAAAVQGAGTGAVTTWDANLNSGAIVRALAMNGSVLYAGGEFATSGDSQANLVALRTDTGAVAGGWTLTGTDGSVDALAVADSTLYLGGGFSGVGNQSRSRLAAVDAATGALQGWNPNANGRVLAITVAGTTVFVGGEFTQVGAQTAGRLGAVEADGTVQMWNPDVDQPVSALAVADARLYVGGQFTAFGADQRLNAAAVRATSPFALLQWAEGVEGAVYGMAADATTVYLAGAFSSVGVKRCRYYCTANTSPE